MCQVASLCVQSECLFVGCAVGVVFVLDKHLLAPLAVVTCNESQRSVDFLLPLAFHAHAPPQPGGADPDTASIASTGKLENIKVYSFSYPLAYTLLFCLRRKPSR